MAHKQAANIEFLQRRQKHLFDSSAAVEWLYKQRLSKETVESFKLGLSGQYLDKNKILHDNALLAPVMNENGICIKQTVYLNIPGMTVNPARETAWSRGLPCTYFSEKYDRQTFLLVCNDVWDLWLTQQALRESEINLLLICATPDELNLFPDEWRKHAFWERFEKIFLGFHNTKAGDVKTVKTAQLVVGETRRLRSPLVSGTSWAEFWQNGGTVKEFYRIISDAGIIGTAISTGNPNSNENNATGRFGYKPMDIATAFHNGHLYYPVRTLVNSQEDIASPITARTETVVVKSDRTIHTVREEPAPRGTPPEERILRLTDGTLVESPPKASIYSTWSWASIEAYRHKHSKLRTLRKILLDVKNFLRASVWLTYAYDYDLLTLLVPVTFAQTVFQSVPIILVVGPPGSGKSALGRAMCRICANAVPIGQISAAAIARLIHETKGFILLDDLESIGKRSKTERPQVNELIQALKVSYSKETSWKIWINVSRGMRQERLNFFGVKMINNTSGADDILGSRMLKINTRKIPEKLLSETSVQNVAADRNLDALRDELHT